GGAAPRRGRRALRVGGPGRRSGGAAVSGRSADVLVLGSGIGGLMLALKLAEEARVLVLTKKRADDSNTNWAQGGIAAVFDAHDSFARHEADTLRAGAGLCDRAVVRAVVGEAPERVRELASLGVHFNQASRGFELGREGGGGGGGGATPAGASCTPPTSPGAPSSRRCSSACAGIRTSGWRRTSWPWT